METKKEVIKKGILYLSFHNLLRTKYGDGQIVTKKNFYIDIRRHFLVKKPLIPAVIKEMENMNLLKKENNQEIRLLRLDYDLEENIGDFYRFVGIL